jgi:hypothetical protein
MIEAILCSDYAYLISFGENIITASMKERGDSQRYSGWV